MLISIICGLLPEKISKMWEIVTKSGHKNNEIGGKSHGSRTS